MKIAFTEAVKAKNRNEVPVGSVIIDETNNIIASNGNRIIELSHYRIIELSNNRIIE